MSACLDEAGQTEDDRITATGERNKKIFPLDPSSCNGDTAQAHYSSGSNLLMLIYFHRGFFSSAQLYMLACVC